MRLLFWSCDGKHGRGEGSERRAPRRCATWGVAMGMGAAHSVCEEGDTRGGAMWGRCGRGTHRDERKSAARVDRDATRVIKLGAAAVAVAEAVSAAAGEGGGRPGGDVDTANAMIVTVLRCIMEEHTE